MADRPAPAGAWAGIAEEALTAAGVRLVPLGPMCRVVLRGAGSAIAAFGDGLGIAAPARVGRFGEAAAGRLLRLGPDEVLALLNGAEDALPPLPGLEGLAHAMVDVSHRDAAVLVAGPRAAWVLAHGCPLDLDPRVFPVGSATRTVFAKAEIVLMRTGADSFHVEVARSFAAYVWSLLAEVAREPD